GRGDDLREVSSPRRRAAAHDPRHWFGSLYREAAWRPVRRADQRAERGARHRRDRHDRVAEGGGQMSVVRAPRVLVVDDEAHLAEGIRENLEAEGYAADVAHDGLEGLTKTREERYDLILLDV